MKRVLILGLALVVAAGVLLILLQTRSAREDPVAAVPRAAAEPTAPRNDVLPAPRAQEDADAAMETNAFRAARRVAFSADDGARYEESLARGDGLLVRVVKQDGEPVPEATVFVFAGDSMTDTDEARYEADGYDIGALFETYGRRFRADERGEVVVPRDFSGGALLGRGDELWGLGSPDSSDAEYELVLAPDPAVRVRVVDPGGAPVAGVLVGLRLRGGDEDGSFDLLRARTDASGFARLEHTVAFSQLIGEDEMLRVGVIAPLMFAVEKRIDFDALDAPIELVLPASGSAALRIVDAAGQPASESYGVRLEWGDDHDAAKGTGPRDRSATFVVDGGSLELMPVALGLDLRFVIASLQSEELAAGSFAGPARAGQRVEWEIEVAESSYLEGRLLLPDGEPCAARVVTFELGRTDRWDARRRRLRTRADGSFRYEVAEPASADGGILILSLPSADEGELDLAQRIVLPPRVARGANDFGDIALAPSPLLVAGTVVDDAGVGLGSAYVWIEGLRPEERWSSVGARRATDDAGAFAIHGFGRATRVRLRAERHGYVERARGATHAAGVGFEIGASDVRVPMVAAGEIDVRVLVDAGMEPVVRVVGFRGTDHQDSIGASTAEYDEDGVGLASLVGLEAGTYTLQVEAGWGETLHVFEDVLVRRGETTRAGDVDLRGALRSLSILVTDALGTGIRASATTPDRDSVWGSEDDGIVNIVTTEDPLDLLIEAFGYGSALVEGVQGGEAIPLASGLSVTLELAGGRPRALREDELLTVRLDSLEFEVAPDRAPQGRFDESGSCKLLSAHGGAHRVVLRLWMMGEDTWRSAVLDASALAPVRILDPGPTQAVVRVADAMIDDARLRARAQDEER